MTSGCRPAQVSPTVTDRAARIAQPYPPAPYTREDYRGQPGCIFIPGGANRAHVRSRETSSMDMNGSYDIAAPREAVWAALNDIDVLKICIPGCESITKHSETELEATVSAKVGPVKAKFTGAVTLSDINPPNGYTISGEGKGGAAGFAKGGAKVSLAENGAGTTLSYEVSANVGGKLAQIGSRLIDSTAKKMADQFFSKFSEEASALGAPPTAAATDGENEPGIFTEPVAPTPVTETVAQATQKPDALNSFRPISFEIWLAMILGIFAFAVIWTIFV